MLLLHWASIAIKDNIKKLRAPWQFDPMASRRCAQPIRTWPFSFSHGIPVVKKDIFVGFSCFQNQLQQILSPYTFSCSYYLCVCKYIYTYIYTHIHTHNTITHIYTHIYIYILICISTPPGIKMICSFFGSPVISGEAGAVHPTGAGSDEFHGSSSWWTALASRASPWGARARGWRSPFCGDGWERGVWRFYI